MIRLSPPGRIGGFAATLIAFSLPLFCGALVRPAVADLLLLGDVDGMRFGASVAPAGDVNGDGFSDLLVGAPAFSTGPANRGRVLLFAGAINGLNPVPLWIADGDQAGAQFGAAVAPAGDVNGDGFGDFAVGAPGYDESPGGPTIADAGRVCIYFGSSTGPSAGPAQVLHGVQSGAHFGAALALLGQRPDPAAAGEPRPILAVGAPDHDSLVVDAGRVHVYRSSSGAFVADMMLTGTQAQGRFGSNIACPGDFDGDGLSDLAVGAPGATKTVAGEGTASVYLGLGTPGSFFGTTPQIVLAGGLAGSRFGGSLAAAGDVNTDGFDDLLVGAPGFSSGAGTAAGRASLFLGSAAGASGAAAWSVTGNADSMMVGLAVATAGDVNGDGYADVIVGAPGALADAGARVAGEARLYLGSAEGLGLAAATTYTIAGSPGDVQRLGTAVATAGDVNGDGFSDVAVGAPDDPACPTRPECPPPTTVGSVLVVQGQARLPLGTRFLLGTQSNARFGGAMAAGGDVNGDGFSDLMVGEPGFNGTFADAGRVSLYLGTDSTLAGSPRWTLPGTQYGEQLGSAVAISARRGPLHGDGFSDIVVGAPGYSNGQSREGAVFVYRPSASDSFPTVPAQIVEQDGDAARLGTSLADAGDVNGDGFSDVIVGAPGWSTGQSGEGAAFIYIGSDTGLVQMPVARLEGNTAGLGLGTVVARAGDVNGDGFGDVLVGTRGGSARLYRGTAAGPDSIPLWVGTDVLSGPTYGRVVAGVGDLNCDGLSDWAVAADSASAGAGRVNLYLGSRTVLPSSPSLVRAGAAGARFGSSVAPAGDVNGDGFSDLLIGAPGEGAGAGAVWLFLGSSSGIEAVWRRTGSGSAQYGAVVSGPADYDGDSFPDLTCAAPVQATPAGPAGAVLIHAGNRGSGVAWRPRRLETAPLLRPFPGGPVPNGDLPGLSLGNLGPTQAFPKFGMGILNNLDGTPPVANLCRRVSGSTQCSSSDSTGGTTTSADIIYMPYDLPPTGQPYRWYVRLYTASPYFPGTRWFTAGNISPGEWSARRADPPVAVPGWIAGSALRLEAPRALPNPSLGTIWITFSVPVSTRVDLDLIDVRGRVVARLVHGVVTGGPQQVAWDGRTTSGTLAGPGFYFAWLRAGGMQATGRILRLGSAR